MTFAGVDKVGLHAKAYTVQTLNGWGEKAGRKVGEPAPVFLRDGQGTPVPGAGFFINTGSVNVDLSPKGLLVTFNPSKARHPYALLTDTADVGRVGDDVQRTLHAHGVDVNVDEMQLVRLDLAKQRQLKHPSRVYAHALGHLQGKRMTGHSYPDGYAFRNTQRETVFYDKARELYDKQGITIPEQRLARVEMKWRKGRPLAKDMGFSSFGDLRRTDPEQLTTTYVQALNRDVFRTDPKAVQLVLNFDTEVSILRSYLSAGRGGVDRYLMDMHVGPHVEELGGWDAFRDMLRQAGQPDRTARYTLQKLRSQAQRAAMVNARRDREAVNLHTLIDELRQSFAA